jgi:hypothetical protein
VGTLVMLVPAAMVLHYGVVMREERYLERKSATTTGASRPPSRATGGGCDTAHHASPRAMKARRLKRFNGCYEVTAPPFVP